MQVTRDKLEKLICNILEIDQINKLIKGQINRMVTEEGYNYQDIARSLLFAKEVYHFQFQPQYGIGIASYYMSDARKYFEKLKREKEHKKREGIKLRESLEMDRKMVMVVPQKHEPKKHKLYDMENF